MYASIAEAWGTDSLETRTQPPSQQTSASVTRNGPYQGWISTPGVDVAALGDAQRAQFVRAYLRELMRRRGTGAVARLLGPRACRKIRDIYLLRWSTDDTLHVILAGLVAALAYRLATK